MEAGGRRIEKKKTVKRQIRDTMRLLLQVYIWNLEYYRPTLTTLYLSWILCLSGGSARDGETNEGKSVEVSPTRTHGQTGAKNIKKSC